MRLKLHCHANTPVYVGQGEGPLMLARWGAPDAGHPGSTMAVDEDPHSIT